MSLEIQIAVIDSGLNEKLLDRKKIRNRFEVDENNDFIEERSMSKASDFLHGTICAIIIEKFCPDAVFFSIRILNRNATTVDWQTGIKSNFPMIQTYINGIFTEVGMLTDSGTGGNKVYESIKHSNKILINTDKAKKIFGNNKIKTILIYNRALEHEEILQNLMADIDNLTEQKRKYDKNYV